MSARLWTATVRVGAQLRINVHMGNNGAFTLLTQTDSPHPLPLQLQWDACGFSLRTDEHFDVQREGEKGQRGQRKREFNCFSCPSLPTLQRSPLFLPYTSHWSQAHLQGFPREACQRRRLEQRWWRRWLGMLFHLLFSFPPEVLFLMTGTKTAEIKKNLNLLEKKFRELSILAAGSTNL